MARLVHLNSLQALEAALRLGSLRKAADELGVTQAAIGQRIRSLELYLDRPLLQRGASGVTPMPMAAAISTDLSGGFAQLERVAETLNLDRDSAVKLRVDPDFLAPWLRDRLPDFHRLHPGVDIVLIAQDHLATAGADIEIFFGSRPGCTALWQDRLVPVLSGVLVEMIRAKAPSDLLEGLPLLHLSARPATENLGWPDWVAQHGHRHSGADRGMTVRNWTDGIAAAVAGAAIFLAPALFVHDLLDQRALWPLTLPNPGIAMENTFCINILPRSGQRRPVAAFARWLIDNAAQFAAERQI